MQKYIKISRMSHNIFAKITSLTLILFLTSKLILCAIHPYRFQHPSKCNIKRAVIGICLILRF